MKKLLTLCSICLITSISAQITLNSTDFSNAGFQCFMSQTQDPTIDYSSTGANYQWDFSGLTATDQVFKQNFGMSGAPFVISLVYGSFAPTAYQASYYTAATNLPIDQLSGFLPVELSDMNQYFRVASSGVTKLGYSVNISGQGVPAKSDTIETQYALPLNYQDDYFSRGYTKLDMNPILDAKWIQHRTHGAYVDGWGQITTPFGTFDVLRVQHHITEVDSMYYMGTWFGVPVPESYEYEWLAQGEGEPILRIRTNVVAGNEVVTSIEYKDFYNPSLGLEQLEIDASIYPNPAEGQVNVTSNGTIQEIIVRDTQGKMVFQAPVNESTYAFDTQSWSPGVYLVFVDGTLGHSVQKLIVR